MGKEHTQLRKIKIKMEYSSMENFKSLVDNYIDSLKKFHFKKCCLRIWTIYLLENQYYKGSYSFYILEDKPLSSLQQAFQLNLQNGKKFGYQIIYNFIYQTTEFLSYLNSLRL